MTQTFDQHFEDYKRQHEFMADLGMASLKALMIMNGGACLALLTLLGHFADKTLTQEPWLFIAALYCFSLGVLATGLAYFFRYTEQYHSAKSATLIPAAIVDEHTNISDLFADCSNVCVVNAFLGFVFGIATSGVAFKALF